MCIYAWECVRVCVSLCVFFTWSRLVWELALECVRETQVQIPNDSLDWAVEPLVWWPAKMAVPTQGFCLSLSSPSLPPDQRQEMLTFPSCDNKSIEWMTLLYTMEKHWDKVSGRDEMTTWTLAYFCKNSNILKQLTVAGSFMLHHSLKYWKQIHCCS